MRSLSCLAAAAVTSLVLSATVPALAQNPTKTIRDGVLDEIRLFVDKPPAVTRVSIRPFSATEADITQGEIKEETKKMMVDAPPMLAIEFSVKMKELGPYTDVVVVEGEAAVPADAMLVEGKFIEMDPGSRAKRYFVGFGAGKSGVTVEGTVKGPDGSLIASFKQRRIGAMGFAGGDSMGKLVADTKDIGQDIAKFLNTWAKGGKLK